MKEETMVDVEVDAEPMKPGFGNFEDLCYWLESLIAIIVPSASGSFTIKGDEDQKRLRFEITFTDNAYIGRFLGRFYCNLRALSHLMRAQQMYVHNRYILFEVVNEEGDKKVFMNKDVHLKNNKERLSRSEQFERSRENQLIVIA